jgi:hypothetical protein
VINCGSSSLKYSSYDTANESRNARGHVDRIGLEGTRISHRGPKGELKRDLEKADSAAAFKAMVAELTSKETGVISGAGEVSVVAHRVVHGGEKFTEGTILTDELITQLEALNPLAPLHNPVIIAGIREMRRLFPSVPHVAVFDTAFHHTLPAYAFLYGLPYEFYEKKSVRRYGFHGTSHHYVSLRAAQFLEKRPNELRLVSCHLGNGSSLCAVDHGPFRSIRPWVSLRWKVLSWAPGAVISTPAYSLFSKGPKSSPLPKSKNCSTRRAVYLAYQVFRVTCARFSRRLMKVISVLCSHSKPIVTEFGNTSAPMLPQWVDWTR